MRARRVAVILALCPLLFACESRVGSFAGSVSGTTSGTKGLTGLSLSNGTLTPTFSNATASYAASVSNTVTSITVTPRAGTDATIAVNGQLVAAGSASQPIPLAVGANNINVSVQTADGTNRTYVVTVTRAP